MHFSLFADGKSSLVKHSRPPLPRALLLENVQYPLRNPNAIIQFFAVFYHLLVEYIFDNEKLISISICKENFHRKIEMGQKN